MIVAENNIYSSEKNLQILNSYSDGCPPCRAFMPNFISAEETFGKYVDFIQVNTGTNTELAQKFYIRGTPKIVIMKDNEIVFNKSGVPSGVELKEIMTSLIGKEVNKNDNEVKEEKKKRFFGLF